MRLDKPLLHICHAPADDGWVRGRMLPALNLAEGQYRTRADDALGEAQLREISRAVGECCVTLLIASSAARWDRLVQHAATLAQHAGVEDGRPRFIVVARDFSPGSRAERALLPLDQRVLVGLDCSDEAQTTSALQRLRELLELPEPIDRSPPCPYPGLERFTPENRHLLFGRDRDRDALLQRIRGRHTRILVLGPAGSGRSSLIDAAVVPELRRQGHVIQVVTWGGDPVASLRTAIDALEIPHLCAILEDYLGVVGAGPEARMELARARMRAAPAPDARRRIVVVDPLEEIFAADAGTRETLLHLLGGLWTLPWCTVILCLRADFRDALMAERCWRDLESSQYPVLPLGEAGLRDAIIEPARQAGVYVEAALVERLRRELDPDRSSVPLPLLQIVLQELWTRLTWRYLTLESYERIASEERRGLAAVLAVHATGVLQTLTEPGDGQIARRILLDLVHLGEGRPHTRRRRTLGELRRAGDTPGQLERVLARLIEGRLITTDHDGRAAAPLEARSFHLAHDALIGGWPALATWVAEHHGALLAQRRLEAWAQEWLDGGRTRGLLDEGDTAEARAWRDSAAGRALGVSHGLVELIEASERAHAQGRDKKLELQQQVDRLALELRKTRATLTAATQLAGQLTSQLEAGPLSAVASSVREQLAWLRKLLCDLRALEALDSESEPKARSVQYLGER